MAKKEQADNVPPAEFQLHVLSAGEIAARLERPLPWITLKLAEFGAMPCLTIDRAEYYSAETFDLVKAAADELAERARDLKREAAAAGM
jgi:hypothetical protein